MDEETYLHEMLALLQREYRKAAEPYLRRLSEIESMRAPAPFIVTVEQARQIGLLKEANE